MRLPTLMGTTRVKHFYPDIYSKSDIGSVGITMRVDEKQVLCIKDVATVWIILHSLVPLNEWTYISLWGFSGMKKEWYDIFEYVLEFCNSTLNK